MLLCESRWLMLIRWLVLITGATLATLFALGVLHSALVIFAGISLIGMFALPLGKDSTKTQACVCAFGGKFGHSPNCAADPYSAPIDFDVAFGRDVLSEYAGAIAALRADHAQGKLSSEALADCIENIEQVSSARPRDADPFARLKDADAKPDGYRALARHRAHQGKHADAYKRYEDVYMRARSEPAERADRHIATAPQGLRGMPNRVY